MRIRIHDIRFWVVLFVLGVHRCLAQMPPHNETNGIDCKDCHATVTGSYASIYSQEQEAICLSCHNPTGTAAAMSDVSYHVILDGNATVVCSTCHDPHGSQLTMDSHPGGQQALNLSLIRGNIGTYLPQAVGPALFQSKPDHFAFDANNPPWNGICQTCHTQTLYHTNDSTSQHEHQIGSVCTSCHRHENGFIASTDSCIGCHGQAQGQRRQITGPGGDFSQRSSHIAGTVDDEDCLVCHEMSQHQKGEVRLKDVDTGGVWKGSRDQWCLTCHDGDPPEGILFPANTDLSFDKSSFGNSPHQQHMGSASCSHCHNGHGSPYPALLKEAYRSNESSPMSQVTEDYALCWRCHDSESFVDGNNVFGENHESHVIQDGTPCSTCHDAHASTDSEESGLIRFKELSPSTCELIEPGDVNASDAFTVSDTLGSCTLSCHDIDHESWTYERQAGSQTHCSPCHLPNGDFVHTLSSSYCSDCHSDDRPVAPHPETEDCSRCHDHPGETWEGASYDHDPPPVACVVCHEDDRPSSPHTQGVDCALCHKNPGDTWLPAAFNHDPPPSECTICHEGDRPESPHIQGGDCSVCHYRPGETWQGASYSHDPPPATCAECHESDRPSMGGILAPTHYTDFDCVSCHTDPGGNWENIKLNGTTGFDHRAFLAFSCLDCHQI